MKKDRETIEKTHAEEWRGFLGRSRSIIRGIDSYMEGADAFLRSPGRIAGYRFEDFDLQLLRRHRARDLHRRRGHRGEGGPRPRPYVRDPVSIHRCLRQERRRMDPGRLPPEHPPGRPGCRTAGASARERGRARRDPEDARSGMAGLLLERPGEARGTGPRRHHRHQRGRGGLAPSGTPFSRAPRSSRRRARGSFRLAFPRTEIRVYGDTIILYTTYSYELETEGQRETYSGRGTEIFVNRAGRLVNVGWHLDSGR